MWLEDSEMPCDVILHTKWVNQPISFLNPTWYLISVSYIRVRTGWIQSIEIRITDSRDTLILMLWRGRKEGKREDSIHHARKNLRPQGALTPFQNMCFISGLMLSSITQSTWPNNPPCTSITMNPLWLALNAFKSDYALLLTMRNCLYVLQDRLLLLSSKVQLVG